MLFILTFDHSAPLPTSTKLTDW